MEHHGFIQDMLDVKVLILAVMSRVKYPVTGQQIYELCYQDDRLTYFDVQEAIPQMVQTGHLEQERENRFRISEKGREAAAVTEDSVAYPVLQRAIQAVEQFNTEEKRQGYIKTETLTGENGECAAALTLRDAGGQLLRMELMAPNERQARRLERAFAQCAEPLYQTIMEILLEEAENSDCAT